MSPHQILTLLGLSPWAWGTPHEGEADGTRWIFGATRCVWTTALHLDPHKKPCAMLCPVGETVDKYQLAQPLHTLIISVWDNTVLLAWVMARLVVGWGAPWPASTSLRGSSPRLKPYLEGLCLSPWAWGAHSREMPTKPEEFLEPSGAFGLWPCTRTYLKILCATLVWLVGRSTNTSSISRCFVQTLFSGLFGICAVADLRPKGPRLQLGHLWVDKLHHRQLCHPCIVLDIAVQFKL